MITFLILLASAAAIGAGRWWLLVIVVAAITAGTTVSLAAACGADAVARVLDRRARESWLLWCLAATVSSLTRHRLGRGAIALGARCLSMLVAAGIAAAAFGIAGMHVPWLVLVSGFGVAELLLHRSGRPRLLRGAG